MTAKALSTLIRTVLCIVFLPISAGAQPIEPPDFLEEIKLTARLHVDAENIEQTIRPIARENATFLDQPVHPVVRYTSPYYGISAGLQFRGAELFGAARTNGGLYPDIPFTDNAGQAMFFGEPVAWTLSLRGQYFLTDYLGVGIKVEERDVTLEDRHPALAGDKAVRVGLLSGRRHFQALSVYVPLQIQVGADLSVDGRVGVGLAARGRERYGLSFIRVKKVSYPYGWGLEYDRDSRRTTHFETETDVSLQFGELGITYRGLGLPLRLAARLRHVSVPRMSDLWSRGLTLRLGLPF